LRHRATQDVLNGKSVVYLVYILQKSQ